MNLDLKIVKKVFITGASGCVGHYVLDHFLDRKDCEVHLLLREGSQLKINLDRYPHIYRHNSNLEHIEELKELLFEMTHVMHIATDWSNSDYARKLNMQKTLEMFSYLNPDLCEKIVYFSTASILGPGNKAIPEAGQYGPGYVRSKYLAHEALPNSSLYDRMVILYPTLVFGGDARHPYSHISSGILPNLHYLGLLRFIYVDGAFHFIHSKDIASVAVYTLFHQTDKQHYVLGNASLSAKEAIQGLCVFFKKRQWVRFKISSGLVFALAALFRIEIGSLPWFNRNFFFCFEKRL